MTAGQIRSTLEIATSARVLQERRRASLREAPGGVILGKRFLTLRGLAQACVAETATPVRGELGPLALARLIRHLARDLPPPGPEVASQPGLAHALAASLRDLRDAGIPPNALPDRSGFLRTLYPRTEQALSSLEAQGFYDRIGFFRLARQGVPAWLQRLGLCEAQLHGATELVGSAGDLIECIAGLLPLRMIQLDWGDAYAAELRREWPWHFEVESAAPEPGTCAPLQVLRARDPREELERVAQQIMLRLEAGVPPARISVVARGLESYAPWLERVLLRYGIPFTSSLRESVLHHPFASVRLELARTLTGPMEREPTLALLRSPRFRWQQLGVSDRVGLRLPQLAERLARRGRVIHGAADWLGALGNAKALLYEEHQQADPETLETLERTLRALDLEHERLALARSWGEWLTALRSAERRWLREPATETQQEVDSIVDRAVHELLTLDCVDEQSPERVQPSGRDRLRALEEALRHATRSPREIDTGGVRVLDAIQARGVRSEHLFMLGLNHGSWPLELPEDPFLPGPLREELRRETGRPLPVPRLQQQEERFLLGLLLSQASHSITLCWQDFDAGGRPIPRSAYLRDLPLPAAEPASPPRAALELCSPSDRFLHASDALVQVSLGLRHSDAPEALPDLAREAQPESVDTLVSGLALLNETEAWSSESHRYDGVLGPEGLQLPERFSPSFLESLGQCPQRALFSRLLQVRETDSPPAHELDQRELGLLLHGVLGRIYQDLQERGELAPGHAPAQVLDTARGLLPQAIAAQLAEHHPVLSDRHRGLWHATLAKIETALSDFLERDLEELMSTGCVALEVEPALGFTHPESQLRIEGRADRIIELPDGELRVGDYKTRADPAAFVSAAGIRKGVALQIPLYASALAAREPGRPIVGEVLAVPLRPERDRARKRARLRSIRLEEIETPSAAVLEVLGQLLQARDFPFRRDAHCNHCAYTLACRQGHPPSEQRVRTAAPFAAYFELHEKKK